MNSPSPSARSETKASAVRAAGVNRSGPVSTPAPASASIRPVPVTVGTKSIKRSPTHTTSAMPALHPEEGPGAGAPDLGCSAGASPALVLGDVLARDQRRGHQNHGLLGLLAVHDLVADLDRLLRHGVGILAGRGHDQGVALQRRLDVRRAVDRGDEEFAPAELLGGEVAAD